MPVEALKVRKNGRICGGASSWRAPAYIAPKVAVKAGRLGRQSNFLNIITRMTGGLFEADNGHRMNLEKLTLEVWYCSLGVPDTITKKDKALFES